MCRCRTNPSHQTKLRLFADSAGFCQRPQCRKRLFSDEGGEDYHIGEMAHVFAAVDGGPRPAPEMDEAARASYENLILLCPSCHTEVDKAPAIFPDRLIREWKDSHKETIKSALGVARYTRREDARAFVAPLFRANKVIFEQLSPDLEYRENPEAEQSSVWKRKMVSQIIPNSKIILLAVDANRHLATEKELQLFELFRQHVDDIVERHLGSGGAITSRFPVDMELIYS